MDMPVVAKPMSIMFTVSDLDRSVTFYSGAFGFNVGHRREAQNGFEPALQLDVVGFRETSLVLGEMVITLCSFASPSVIPKSKEPFNQIGIKRITFGVPDIADAARRVELHGGKVLEHTRYEHALATLVVVTDPDGIELELIQRVT